MILLYGERLKSYLTEVHKEIVRFKLSGFLLGIRDLMLANVFRGLNRGDVGNYGKGRSQSRNRLFKTGKMFQ